MPDVLRPYKSFDQRPVVEEVGVHAKPYKHILSGRKFALEQGIAGVPGDTIRFFIRSRARLHIT